MCKKIDVDHNIDYKVDNKDNKLSVEHNATEQGACDEAAGDVVSFKDVGFVALMLTKIVKFYQYWISPMLGNNCRFYPTCSQYMIDAIVKKGVVVGVALGVYRILRCNPLFNGGHDPVK